MNEKAKNNNNKTKADQYYHRFGDSIHYTNSNSISSNSKNPLF